MRAVTVLILAAGLAACGGKSGEPPSQPFTADGVQFSLTPSAARNCDPETRYVARVAWDVQRAGRVRLEIRIDEAEGPLLARIDDSGGSVETGEWVARGMWFLLIDRDNGELLAAQRAGPERCD